MAEIWKGAPVAAALSEEIAAEAERQLKEKFGDELNVIIHNVNPTIGSHCGPNALGICFHAIHR